MPQWRRSSPRTELPRNWPQLCLQVRAIYGTACHVCGHQGAADTDHLVPRSLGGTDSLDNLRPICGRGCPYCRLEGKPSCHLSKSGREGAQALAARRSRRRPPEPHPGLIR